MSKKQYDDEVSWTTRTWSSLMAQRMSVALHMAAEWEIARELCRSRVPRTRRPSSVEGSPTPLPKKSHRTSGACAPCLAPFECGGVSLCWCVWVPSAYRVSVATRVVAKIYRPFSFERKVRLKYRDTGLYARVT